MILLSINTKTHQVTVWACAGEKRAKMMSPTFDRPLDPEEVDDMRRDPIAFMHGVNEVAPEAA